MKNSKKRQTPKVKAELTMNKHAYVNIPWILDALKVLADQDYQLKVWIKGKGDEVSDLDEEVAVLFNDSGLDIALDRNEKVFDVEIDEKLKKLSHLIVKLNLRRSSKIEPPIIELLRTKEWSEIRALSDELYHLVKANEVTKNWSPERLKLVCMDFKPASLLIREVLLQVWDPIGFGAHLPKDEYDSYISQIYKCLRTEDTLALHNYLEKVERDVIGLTPNYVNIQKTILALENLKIIRVAMNKLNSMQRILSQQYNIQCDVSMGERLLITLMISIKH